MGLTITKVFWVLAAIKVEKIMELGKLYLRELWLCHLVTINRDKLLSLGAVISSSVKWGL